MLGKRSRSVIGRLSELLAPGSRSGVLDSSPSPLDIFSRKRSGNGQAVARGDNSKNPNNRPRIFERGHGVGLAIVVALEKPSSSPPSYGSQGGGGRGFCSKYVVCGLGGYGGPDQDRAEEEEEDYTYVTFHGPRESFTMVYYDRSELSKGGDGDGDGGCSHDEFPGLGFLSSCQLCGKKFHGQNIYIYRGENGFCSAECRSAQIMVDERSEQCRSEASRVGDACSYSTATYSESQIFSTSIIAI